MKRTVIDVQENEYKKARAPDVLVTEGIGPCTGIGMIDTATKTGYLAHLNDYDVSNGGYRRFTNWVTNEIEDRSSLIVKIAGRSALDDNDGEGMRRVTEAMVAYMVSKGIQRSSIDLTCVLDKPADVYYNMKVIPAQETIKATRHRTR